MFLLHFLKVTFHPVVSGSYEAMLCVYASQMTSTSDARDTPTAAILLKSSAEMPQVELRPSHAPGAGGSFDVLDFGVVMGGAAVEVSLELINRGRSKVPLKLSITSDVSKKK